MRNLHFLCSCTPREINACFLIVKFKLKELHRNIGEIGDGAVFMLLLFQSKLRV